MKFTGGLEGKHEVDDSPLAGFYNARRAKEWKPKPSPGPRRIPCYSTAAYLQMEMQARRRRREKLGGSLKLSALQLMLGPGARKK